MPNDHFIGERIAYYRKRLGLSQIEFAGLVGRSESWVSQVERGVRPLDRMSVLQRVANALSLSVAELRGEEEPSDFDESPEAFDTIRLALTGHPALAAVLGTANTPTPPAQQIETLRRQHGTIWQLQHATNYTELAPTLAALIPGLETLVRTTTDADLQAEARELLSDTYRVVAAAMLKTGDPQAAWVAADRAAFTAEAAGSPLAVAASMFRIAHVFLSFGQLDQAQHVATNTAQALEPMLTPDVEPEVLSLYGACHLVLAVAAARDANRSEAHKHLDTARAIAERLGADRNDYETEFGPTNVAIHAVSIAVELGDAGQALELAQEIHPVNLSAERQARHLISVAQAYTMRRQIGEALSALQEAERIAPELAHVHYLSRAVARDLLQLSGTRPRSELRDLAERFGALP